MATPPSVNRQMIEGLLDELLANPKGLRLVLVHGRYDSPDTEFTATLAKAKRRVRVTDQGSVLGIVEAMQQHQKDTVGTDDVLVVTTGVEDNQLGWDVRAHAIKHATRTVHRDEIVKHRFGAVDIDPRIRNERWLLDALLAAEPAVGWRRVGGVLTRDAAISALVEARVGAAATADGVVDIAAVLEWSCTSGAARFGGLDPAEQAGVAAWLGETVGAAAPVVLRLATEGRARDAMPLGVLGSILDEASDDPDVSLALGGLLPGIPRIQITHLARAVQDTLVRWVADGRRDEDRRMQVLEVVRRADELAAGNGLTDRLVGSRFALSGFQARLRELAERLTSSGKSAFVSRMEAALDGVRDHALATLLADRVHVAEMAVRLRRWLTEPEPTVTGVDGGVRGHLTEWGWVDRALAVLWAGDHVPDPVVAQAYRTVYQAVRDRRSALDEAFASALTRWAPSATSQAPGDSLLIEHVLATVAVPLAGHAPVVIVLDAMSSAVAVELGDELARGGWLEASPRPGERIAAVAMIPSVTTVSRASLLSGRAVTGSKPVERTGFRDFWHGHGKRATLLHSADIAGDGGHRLSGDVLEAFADGQVFGVVLNTIDDALDHGREGERTGWRVADITYLTELLDTARMYRRPVVLVADHGHVLERSPAGIGPATVDNVESARWHTGTPGDGEVELTGPRVLYGNGRVVVPWREDIRYVKRHAGYHGGAALAEMTVPALVLLPDPELLPEGWVLLSAESVTPAWWETRRTAHPAEPSTGRAQIRPKKRSDSDAVPLFQVEAEEDVTLGERVVATEVYATQKSFVRKAPEPQIVADVINALAASDGRMSLVAIAAMAGRAGRIPDAFAITLQRLLNVETYPVFGLIDGGRTAQLDVALLREQFGLGER